MQIEELKILLNSEDVMKHLNELELAGIINKIQDGYEVNNCLIQNEAA